MQPALLRNGNHNALVKNYDCSDPASVIISTGSAVKNDVAAIRLDIGGGFMTKFFAE